MRVLITGAGGGLGRAFAQAFAARGDEVLAADLTGTAFAVDVSDEASVQALAAAAGPIDVLVNNAAIYAGLTRAPFDELSVQEWDRVMAVNLKGPWLCAKHCRVRDGGSIVNVSSATVFSGSPHWAHYVASKAGLIGLTRTLARELGTRGVRVNALAPGFTLTDASRELVSDAETYGVDRGALRRGAQPDDIVGAALFLASEQSAFITGQTLVVDGGRQFV